MAVEICYILYPQKLALTSLTSGGRSVGIFRSQTNATEFVLFVTVCTSVYQDFLCRVDASVRRFRSSGGTPLVRSLFMWISLWDKCHWGAFSPVTSVSPANFHSTDSYSFIHLSINRR
jgi:hypothetical protein